MDRNNISRVSGTGQGLPSLQELKLVKNAITTETLVSSQLLNNLPALTSLNLNNNNLRELPGLIFQECKALEVLKLSKNQLVSLGDGVFYGLSRLRTLSLDQNNLTSVTKNWLFGLESLEELSLRHNSISNIDSYSWKNTAPKLISLDLSYNRLVSLHTSSLEGLQQLQLLVVSHNHLSSIQPRTFVSTPHLLQLDLSYNDLRWPVEEPGEAFYGLSKLMRLDLSYNAIEAVQYKSLAPMERLSLLDLSGNAIRTLHDNPFRHLQPGEGGEPGQVIMNTTALVCDCHLLWVQDWLNTTTISLDRLHATCSYPNGEIGRSIQNLKSATLSCDHTPRPLIQSSPEDRIILLDADVELHCKALVGSRGGIPDVLWSRNQQVVEPYKLDKKMTVVKPDPEGGVISELVSTLHLSNVQHRDEGYYQCVVRNDHGVDYSDSALIEVQVKPHFTIRPSNINTAVDGVARLDCAADGEPTPEISLQKGGSDDFPAARERRLVVEPDDTVFFIRSVTVHDEGTYTCTARSTAGVVQASANITVTQAPFFVHPVSDVTSRPGESAVMQCQGGGRPEPSISWVREGVVLTTAGRHVNADGGQFLIVMDVRPEDAGTYTCQLTNTYGTRRQTIHLSVIDGLLVDGHTTLGLVMMAVVVCVVITSLVWVIIIFHSRRKDRSMSARRRHNTLGQYAGSLSLGSPRHETFLPIAEPLLNTTEIVLTDDPTHGADVVLVGPDTSSEHSTGKDSGVGDSSQRSSEDLRQIEGIERGTCDVPGTAVLEGQHSTASSALLLYADHNGHHLSAMTRGGSSLSVTTDSDSRYEDSRPRLSTFGSGGCATLRRPASHRPIPVSVPSILPRRHITTTLPHKHSFKAHQLGKRDPDNLSYFLPGASDLMRSPSLQRPVRSSSPCRSPSFPDAADLPPEIAVDTAAPR
ncbi:hypothetical protein HAZT_HAZT001676 [Hyalella azteca]|uniref:Ig-like domain-containing protein n=1 Tax=Hyalella azteca TaxID=294128 RepID=A0A6A0HH16_HYAAZ|nr:hypothetical protein HAZT_HAZT001676 [Hyalella azteca]